MSDPEVKTKTVYERIMETIESIEFMSEAEVQQGIDLAKGQPNYLGISENVNPIWARKKAKDAREEEEAPARPAAAEAPPPPAPAAPPAGADVDSEATE